jgi:hypothetical protein
MLLSLENKIIIGFSRPRSILEIQGPIIEWAMGTPYDHVYIRLKLEGHDVIFQASHGYVNLRNYKIFKKECEVLQEYDFHLQNEQCEQLMEVITSTLGCTYDFLGVLGFLWILIGRRLGFNWNNPLAQRSEYFCSELVTKALEAMKFDLSSTPDDVSPKDLEDWILKNANT